MDLPHRFGKYELLEHVATGGMAEVFRARSFGVDGFEKHLVIKRILPGLARDPRFVGLFVKEARISAGMSHPNLVQVYELGRVVDDHYMAMEFIHGRDLARVGRALRRSGGRVPVNLAVYIAVSVMRALAYAHALTDPVGRPLGLVHRDVSPHNVMLGFEGEVKLFDFGIAGLSGEGTGGGGKHGYLSPEQLDGAPLDGRSDVFCVGILLWELITGQRLFGGADLEAKRIAVRAAVIPDPRDAEPRVPQALVTVLRHMLARRVEDRPESADAAAEMLSAALFPQFPAADARAARAFMRDLFPEEAARPSGATVDLGGLARDLEALGDGTLSRVNTSSPEPFSAEPGLHERKTVVVLAGEMVGLTDLSAAVESERIVRRNLRFLRRMRRCVARHGGRIESWQDDTFLAFFGLPRTSEHDLERALACARDICAIARDAPPDGPRTDLVIGVHTGEISVGTRVGRRLRYLGHGDTMKLSRRLCMEGDLGEVLVSELVARLARRRWHLAPGPRVRLRGAPQPLRSWRLLRPRRRVEADGGRWMPRGRELDVVREALERLGGGQGGLLSVQGAAGTGKSRLLRELLSLSRRRGVGVFAVRGLPYSDERSLRVLRDLAAGLLGVDPQSPRSARAEALARLDQLDLEPEERVGIRRLFMSTPAATARGVALPTLERLLSPLICAIAREQPFIIALEDVQYLAPAALEILAGLVTSTEGTPILWWLSSREGLPKGLPAPASQVELGPMDDTLAAALASDILGVEAVAPSLLRRVVRASEGNPLFVESLVGSLLRSGELHVDEQGARLRDVGAPLRAPPDLEALLAERVDRQEPDVKGMLQLAAIIGADVSRSLLREAAGLDRCDELLATLEERGLLVADAGRAETLSFCSPLLWQVVHHSILARERRAAHGAVALAIERLHGDDLEAHWEELAVHFAGAGRFLDAARSARRAGQILASQQLLDGAASTFERALGWTESARDAGEPGDGCTLAQAWLSLDAGAVGALRGDVGAAERHLHLAMDLAAEMWMPEVEARAQLELGCLYRARSRDTLAVAHLDAALGGGAEHRDCVWSQTVGVEALEALGQLAMSAGDGAVARQRFEEARSRSSGDDALVARSQLGLANVLLRSGDGDGAQTLLTEARAGAVRAADRILEGRVVNNMGLVHHAAGRYRDALACFQESRRIREGLGYRRGVAVNLHNIGDTWARLGERALAWGAFTESRSLARRIRWRAGEVMNDVWMAGLEAEEATTGAPRTDARIRLEAAISDARTLADPETILTGRRLLAATLLRDGKPDEARAELEAAHGEAVALDARVMATELERAITALPG